MRSSANSRIFRTGRLLTPSMPVSVMPGLGITCRRCHSGEMMSKPVIRAHAAGRSLQPSARARVGDGGPFPGSPSRVAHHGCGLSRDVTTKSVRSVPHREQRNRSCGQRHVAATGLHDRLQVRLGLVAARVAEHQHANVAGAERGARCGQVAAIDAPGRRITRAARSSAPAGCWRPRCL